MLGFKSLEAKLRDGDGKSAQATVLEHKVGIHTTEGGDEHGFGGTDITRHHFKLRVQPQGEQAFEAKAVIRANHLWPMPDEGDLIPVLYDPNDLKKVAIDTEAFDGQRQADIEQAEQVRHQISSSLIQPQKPDPIAQLEKLAALHDRGVLTDAEFQAEKAKLLAE
jgi:hypothetical protein